MMYREMLGAVGLLLVWGCAAVGSAALAWPAESGERLPIALAGMVVGYAIVWRATR